MKNILPILLLLFVSTLAANAQGAKKYVLFEHFTQASCGPCAEQNPAFQALYGQNETTAHHIAYHTSWPGFDPMYQHNPSEPTNRVSYYGVTGVPDMYTNGGDSKSPANVTQVDIDNIVSQTSPISISVEQERLTDTEGIANISVTTHGAVPSGNWVIRVAVVEKMINYSSAPGSNGERDFPNVFRKMLTSMSGESFEAAAIGESTNFSYSYTTQEEWNVDQLYILAFVQNNSTKEVLNSGSSIDIPVQHTSFEWANIKQVNAGETASFAGSMQTLYKSLSNLQFSLTTDAPDDWSASMVIGDLDLPIDFAQLPFEGNVLSNLGIKVVAGATKALARYELTITLADAPLVYPMKITYFVNNGVKDVIVDNATNPAWGPEFNEGLAFAGSEGFGRISKKAFIDGVTFQALNGMENVYFNVGWTFPALNQDFLFMLMNRMDAGVNLLIMGQDIGWEVEGDNSPYSTPLARSFFRNYLHAEFVADGNGSNSVLTPVSGDEDFGHLINASIIDYYSGSFYPDQIKPDPSSQFATPIFNYNNSSSKIAGIKANTGVYKMVYVGIGLEMMGTEENRNAFMKATHDWFHGMTTDIAFDEALSNIGIGQNYPNPSNQFTKIDVTNINRDLTLILMDAAGKKVMEQTVVAGSKQIQLPTAHLQNGIYVYQLKTDNTILSTRKLVVTH
ncbi:MAG: Omp28-related outer membrane protein [Chitinophagales bacterium]